MSRTLFISDLHLDASRPSLTRGLGRYLSLNEDCKALYILGDLFEVWAGDDDDSALASEVTGMLARFSAAGPQLFIMHGNRDFLLGRDFCLASGATLLPDPTVIDLYGVPTVLLHGDSLCTDDSAYQGFRRTARDPVWQQALLEQSLEQRRALATSMRGMSRAANAGKADEIMDVNQAEVQRVMRASDAAQMIHGHTHRPARHQETGGPRWVLGDWGAQAHVLEAQPGIVKLDIFNT